MIAVRARLPVFLEREKTQTIALDLYEAGAASVPASGTVTIYDSSSNKIVDAAIVALTTTGVSYQVSSAVLPASLSFSDRWRVVWVLTFATGDNPLTFQQQAHLCRSRLYPVISDVDVYERHPEFLQMLPPNETSWQKWIDGAFITIEQRLLRDSKRPAMILNSDALAELHLELGIARIAGTLATMVQVGGKYDTLAKDKQALFETLWGQLRFHYDYNEDGLVADTEQNVAAEPVLYLTMTPGDWLTPISYDRDAE